MKKLITLASLLLAIIFNVCAQPDFIKQTFPKGTIFHQNLSYASDTLKKHLLDIYIPENMKPGAPLIVWFHGGAWQLNDKYADMGYMTSTLKSIMDKGYALASIDYRYSTTKPFPAQIQDCNQALSYLHANASKYNYDNSKIVLMGFSAGGHLASLVALSNNEEIPQFYHDQKKPEFKIKAVLDFYGPSQFMMFFLPANQNSPITDPISKFLGASPILRPDISDLASPATHVDKDDPPFFIVHGEKDQDVPVAQSILLDSYLRLAGVKHDLTIVKDAPHYGVMFDAKEIRTKLFRFLDDVLK